ncbi:MAG: penicillin acylase family protein [Sphingomonadales bacterium]
MQKIVLRAFLVTLAVFALVAMAVYLWARTSLPAYDGVVDLNGPDAPIEIIRDAHAVPHIRAESAGDAFFGLGYVHAQDRLWQLEMHRRIASGNLAAVLGQAALPADIFMRTLGVHRAAQRAWPALDAATQHMLTRYTDGINAYLTARAGALPPEFLLLQTTPQPWTPVDSLAWLKMMAWDLSGNWRQERIRLALMSRLSPRQVSEFMTPYPGDPAFVPPATDVLYPGLSLRAQPDQTALLPLQTPGLGSNSWAVASDRSATGKPLLANDPHLGLNAPSLWYLARLEFGGRNLVGATMAGMPLVVLGRNDHMAWGFTTTAADVQDLYIERLAGDEAYQTETGNRLFLTREETIAVRGGKPVIVTVRATRHGPVISDALPELKSLIDDDHVIALRWVALDDGDTTMASGRRLMLATTVQEGFEALRDFVAPMQNILLADDQGGIGLIAPGKVPVRNDQSLSEGMVPARGWTGTDEWIGWIPFQALPRRRDPADGVLATANEKIVGADYPYYLTNDWTAPYRADRIAQLLAQKPEFTADDFKAMQYDALSLEARALKSALLATGGFGERHAAVRARLADWDGEMAATAPEPLIYVAWEHSFAKRLFGDELGPLFVHYQGNKADFMIDVLSRPGLAPWCDDVTTPARTETCASQAAAALDDAMARLKQAYGRDWQAWRWDRAHRIRHRHQPMSDIPVLNRLFEVAMPGPGGPGALNVAYPGTATKRPYDTVIGPSFRAIYDLARLDRSLYVTPTGQSGNPLSRHYDDFAAKWRQQGFIRIETDGQALEAGALGRLILRPSQAREEE